MDDFDVKIKKRRETRRVLIYKQSLFTKSFIIAKALVRYIKKGEAGDARLPALLVNIDSDISTSRINYGRRGFRGAISV
jgi:hypothetical protein